MFGRVSHAFIVPAVRRRDLKGPNDVLVPTAVPKAIKSGRFAGLMRSVFRVLMTEDAKFALGF